MVRTREDTGTVATDGVTNTPGQTQVTLDSRRVELTRSTEAYNTSQHYSVAVPILSSGSVVLNNNLLFS